MEEASASPVASSPVASWADRVGALLLDLVVLAPLWVLAIVIAESSTSLGDLMGWALLALWIYGRLLDSVRGQSPAKALLGLRVVDAETGGQLSLQRALMRWAFGLLFIVILGPINYVVVPLVSRRHQTMHDMIGSAVVIKDPNSRARLGPALWAWSARTPATTPITRSSYAVDPDPPGVLVTVGHPNKGRRVLIAVVAIVSLIVADWYLRNREMDHLLDAVEESEQSMVTARDQMDAAGEDFVAGLNARGCSGGTASFECQQYFNEHWAAVSSAIQTASASGAASVRRAGAEVEQVDILPWHGGLKDARSAYLEHSEAWYRHLTAVADDVRKLEDRSDSADISSTFSIAEARFRDAVPFWALFAVDQRIADIWAE